MAVLRHVRRGGDSAEAPGARAAAAVRAGARLVGTNDDATYPTPEGPIPGTSEREVRRQEARDLKAEIAAELGNEHSSFISANLYRMMARYPHERP